MGLESATHPEQSLKSLDGLRLVASIGIVAFHYSLYLDLGRWTSRLDLCVDMFFVVSGVVIGTMYLGRIRNLSTYGDFLRRRLARIYPLHLLTLGFYVLVAIAAAYGALNVVDPKRYDFAQIPANLLMTHAWTPDGKLSFNYPSWSISAEWFVYLAFPLIAVVVGRGAVVGIVFVGVLLAAAIWISEGLYHTDLTALNWKLGLLRAIPGFAFGVWLSRYARSVFARFSPASLVLAAAVLGVAIVILIALQGERYLILMCAWMFVASLYLCDLNGRATWLSWGPISSKGYLTYSLYMIHPVVATVFIAFVFPKLFGVSYGAVVASVCLGAVISFIGAELSYRFFETPTRTLINGLGARRAPAKAAA